MCDFEKTEIIRVFIKYQEISDWVNNTYIRRFQDLNFKFEDAKFYKESEILLQDETYFLFEYNLFRIHYNFQFTILPNSKKNDYKET